VSAVTPSIEFVGAKTVGGLAPELANVPDIHPGWGALGGLHTALAACKSSWAAVVACDLPFVTGELFLHLASLREDFDAVVPVQSDERPQPLCALYRCEACLPKASELIASGERRPRALLAAINTRWVSPAELADLDGAPNFFANINNPDDYQRALSLFGPIHAEN
jgi:molybdopterin-guanine dinucleotide biosynthesis protein A